MKHTTSSLVRMMLALGYAFTFLLGSSVRADNAPAAEPEALVKLRSQYDAACQRADQPLRDFGQTYVRSLTTARDTARTQGNLDAVLAIETEIQAAADGTVGQNATYEPLHELQISFAKAREQASKDVAAAHQNLRGIYLGALADLQKNLTKNNDLAGALMVKQEITNKEDESSAGAKNSPPGESLHFLGKRWIAGNGTRFTFHAGGTGFQENDTEPRMSIKWKPGPDDMITVEGVGAGHSKATYYFRFDTVRSGVWGTNPKKLNRPITLK